MLVNTRGGDLDSPRLAGRSRVELEVWSLNHRALEFYARRGWEIDGRSRPAHAGTHYLGMVLRSLTSP